MKLFTVVLVAVLSFTGLIDNIAAINKLKREAEEAYRAKEYKTAIRNYKLLLDSMQVQDEHIRMNLANSYLMVQDTMAAQQQYSQLINTQDKQLKSVAYQQLGIINTDKQQYKEALSLFKESLKSNPANNDSRYNYELVKKLLEQQQEQQEQQQDDQQQDQQDQQQDQQDQQQQEGEDQQEQENQEGEQSEQGEDEQQADQQQGQDGEQKPEDAQQQNMQEGEEQSEGEKNEDEPQPVNPAADKLKEMNLSEEKAKMILDAMRNSEMQYIQQNRRKATQPHDRSKPDW